MVKRSVQSKQREDIPGGITMHRQEDSHLNSVISGSTVFSSSFGHFPAWINTSPASQHHLRSLHSQNELHQLLCFPFYVLLFLSSSTNCASEVAQKRRVTVIVSQGQGTSEPNAGHLQILKILHVL